MGTFDDLIPKTPGAAATPAPAAGGTFADLIPAEPAADDRATRLRKMALAAMPPGGAGDVYKDSFTLGLQKPVAGLATGVGNMLTGKSGFGEGYVAGTGAYDDWLEQAKKDTGWGGTAASIAGSLTPGAAGKTLAKGVMPVMRAAAELGAVEGAARNSEDVGSAGMGAVGGAATGAATAGLLSAAGQLLPGARRARLAEREAARGIPPDQLKSQARSLYKQLDNSGTAYDIQQATDFADAIRSDLVQNGWDPRGVHRPLNGVMQRIEGLRNGPMSLETLQQIREQLASNAQSIEPQVRRIAGRIMRNLDGYIGSETPAMSNLPPDQIAGMWGQARRLWRAANTAEDIGWRVSKAERRAASTNSGQNTENAIRQNIRGVLDKAEQPTRYNPYNQAELDQMSRIVEGTGPQNSLRWAGNQLAGIPSQSISGLLTSAGMLGTHGLDPFSAAMAGGAGLAAGAGVTGVGHTLKNQAARMAQDEADTLMRLITTGSTAPMPAMAGPPTRQALAELMRRQRAAIGAGSVMAGTATGQ